MENRLRAGGRLAVLAALALVGSAVSAIGASAASASTPAPGHAPPGQCRSVTGHDYNLVCVTADPAKKTAARTSRQIRQAGLASQQRVDQQRTGAAGAAVSPDADSGPPSTATPPQCDFDAASYNSNPDRVDSCVDNGWTITAFMIDSDGVFVPQGTLTFDDFQWVTYSTSSTVWTHGLVIEVQGGTGELIGGAEASVQSMCTAEGGYWCTVVSSVLPDGSTAELIPGTVWTNAWVEEDSNPQNYQTPDYVQTFDGYLGVFMEGESVGFWANEDGNGLDGTSVLIGRCDSEASSVPGCVNEDYAPLLTYDSTANPLVAPVAQHIYNAQHGGLQTAWGEPADPLNRTVDEVYIDDNRATACGSVTVPSGDSCDEYPLASTYQGAYFQDDYSTAVVPSSANNSQGGLTGTFYTSNRVIDGDPFMVDVVLANGTYSW